jgi:spore coat polysaccharide biosynthesis predicted glycosyltransferase SpsG
LKVFFKSESNSKVGGGHLQRSIQLAKEFKRTDVEPVFIFSESPEFILKKVRDQGFKTISLAPEQQLLFQEYNKFISEGSAIIFDTDDYRFYSGDLIDQLRTKGVKTACYTVTDNYFISTDYLINPNIISSIHNYNTPSYTEKMLGPEFMIFRDEFRSLPAPEGKGNVKDNLLVIFGNADPNHLTSFFIDVLNNLAIQFKNIKIVAGRLNPDLTNIKKKVSDFKDNIELYIDTQDILNLYLKTDVAITAGGMAMWEMALFYIPQLVIGSSEREIEYTDYLSELGFIHKLGDYKDMIDPAKTARRIEDIMKSNLLEELELDKFRKSIDPLGASKIVSKIIEAE